MEKKDLNRLEEYYKSNSTDSRKVEALFEDKKNEYQLKESLNKNWEQVFASKKENKNLDHVLHNLHYLINTKNKSSFTYKINWWISRVAVALLIPLLTVSIFLFVSNNSEPIQFAEIIAPKGEKAQFVLPDGSTGYLNSGSTLRYAYPFMKKRLVTLNGEAFFDVEHNSTEFIVQANELKVIVHGTRFNVCAYEDDPEIKTTLEKGSVSVIRNADSNGLKLGPGQQATFVKADHGMYFKKVDVDLYVSWKDNMLRVHNAPFIDVVKKMERWYDVKIILEENLKYTQRYTMTIKTESLREMLDLMIVTTPMKYEIKQDMVYITNLKNDVLME